MSDMRDMANGLKAMNNLNQRFSPQQQQTETGAPAPPPPPPVVNPAAAALPPPTRHTGPPPVRAAAGIGSCTAQFDYQSAVGRLLSDSVSFLDVFLSGIGRSELQRRRCYHAIVEGERRLVERVFTWS